MAPLAVTAASLLASAVLVTRAVAQEQTCFSYGIDFQNKGSYFQNVSSSDPFTFVSLFEGCQVDVANNILVDPNGNEHQCTDTPLTPADTNQISTCPLNKNALWNGDWSVIIISNNGDSGIPIAYERDFYLTVGVPATTTFVPTLTLTTVTTPIVNITTTTTTTDTTITTKTTTVPSKTYSPTVTSTPKKVTTTVTKTAGTVSKTARVVVPSVTTKTKTASCSIPPKQQTPDPKCTITPTLVTAAALATNTAKAKFRRVADVYAVPLDREQRLAERKARRALNKRSPDIPTYTVTDDNTSNWATTTTTSTAADLTMTITTQAVETVTSTTTTTIQSGKTTLAVVTITAPTPTLTRTKYTVITTTVSTSTKTQKVTVTTTTTNQASASVCTVKGGTMS